MVKRILVASDLSHRSRRAILRAVRLAVGLNADLQVLHVLDDAFPEPLIGEIRASAEAYLKSMVTEAQDGLGDRLVVDVRFGTVWKTVLAAAEQGAADLIVLGAHRNRGLAELFRGTTLDRVARRARVPVLMVPVDPVADYRNILVGVDFSPASSAAAACAAALAPEGRLTLLSSYHVPFKALVDRAEPGDEDVRAEKKRIEQELGGRMADFAKSLPFDAESHRTAFVEGGAARALIDTATYEEADLICVGCHGRSWLTRTLLGSTAEELLYAATCDVLIARS